MVESAAAASECLWSDEWLVVFAGCCGDAVMWCGGVW